MENLPPELAFKILKYLSLAERSKLFQLRNKKLRKFLNAKHLWQNEITFSRSKLLPIFLHLFPQWNEGTFLDIPNKRLITVKKIIQMGS